MGSTGEGSGEGSGCGSGLGSGCGVGCGCDSCGCDGAGEIAPEVYSTLTISFLYQPGHGSPKTPLSALIVPELLPTRATLTISETSIPQSLSWATYLATTLENTIPSGA